MTIATIPMRSPRNKSESRNNFLCTFKGLEIIFNIYFLSSEQFLISAAQRAKLSVGVSRMDLGALMDEDDDDIEQEPDDDDDVQEVPAEDGAEPEKSKISSVNVDKLLSSGAASAKDIYGRDSWNVVRCAVPQCQKLRVFGQTFG